MQVLMAEMNLYEESMEGVDEEKEKHRTVTGKDEKNAQKFHYDNPLNM